MRLAEFALLLDASPKWVLNTLKALGADGRYSCDMARQLTIARAIHGAASVPMSASWSLARRVLREPITASSRVELRLAGDGDVSLTVDVYRVLSSFNVRLATVRETYAPKARGRPRSDKGSALEVAVDWGLDLSLIRDNMNKSPAQRLRQLDDIAQFSRTVRRSTRHRESH